MKPKVLIERLLIFFIGLPAVAALVLFLPFYNNLAMNLVAVFLSGIGAVEFSLMLKTKQINYSKKESFILGALAPIAITLNVSFSLPSWIIFIIFLLGLGWVLLSVVFVKEFENVINKVIGGFSLFLYPGFFFLWLIKMTEWGNNYIVFLFLLIIIASDSIAWLFGSLFGAKNRGIIAASPNKSIAGFIGGLLGPVIITLCAVFIKFPLNIRFFPENAFLNSNISYMIIIAVVLGVFTSIAAMLGDLAESAIKRSSDFKDSGNFILGRGGVLDSIDSIIVASPVFYFLYYFLFMFANQAVF
ncbi:MAG: phosphatidate cytidylyltransferase [Treponema sp.]|nr:phosphatidate cytidylyltransferase [Treponema sp.]MCL2251215.1 phosphatidate cytidylyltransferase [Treponema sp.]